MVLKNKICTKASKLFIRQPFLEGAEWKTTGGMNYSLACIFSSFCIYYTEIQ